MGAAAALASSALWAFTSVLLASQSGRLRPPFLSAVRSLTARLILIGPPVPPAGRVHATGGTRRPGAAPSPSGAV